MTLDNDFRYGPLAGEEEMPTSLPAIQVLLRLQYLRGQTHRWQLRGTTPDQGAHELTDALSALQGLATTAQAAGFAGFAGLCQRMAVQFELQCPQGRVSNGAARLFITWTQNADRHLRKPASRTLIAVLVSQLGAADWTSPLSARDQDRFIHDMLAPFA